MFPGKSFDVHYKDVKKYLNIVYMYNLILVQVFDVKCASNSEFEFKIFVSGLLTRFARLERVGTSRMYWTRVLFLLSY